MNLPENFYRKNVALPKLYPEQGCNKVISIHHQAIKALGKGLWVETHSANDRLIEAIRLEGKPYGVRPEVDVGDF